MAVFGIVVLTVATVFALTMTVMVTTSLGFKIPISTVTLRVEVLVVELPLVVVTLRISTYDEN